MAHDFTMPKLGLTMTEGMIREWLVADGTRVDAGDPVLIIETDKVETEVEAREAGILSISGAVGETYECGAVIGRLLAEGESEGSTHASETVSAPATAAPVAAAGSSSAPAPPSGATTAVVARNVTDTNVTPTNVTDTNVTHTDVANRGDGNRILASPMARAAARNAGVDLAHIVGTGPGGRIVAPDVISHVETATAAPATTPGGKVVPTGDRGRILASPMARAAARDLGVELGNIAGTGPGGRIVADDVTRFAEAQTAVPSEVVAEAQTPVRSGAGAASRTPAAASDAMSASADSVGNVAATGGGRMLAELLGIDLRRVPAATPGARVTREDVAAWVREQLNPASPDTTSPPPKATTPATPVLQEPSTLVPLRGMRGVIAERMYTSVTEMAQLTLSIDADMSAVNAERTRLKLADLPVPGYTAWVIAAASRALVDHPYVNSQITPDGVAYLPDVHLGVAVALDNGLIVPVIRRASGLSVDELHTTVADLAARARDGKVAFDELEGGTFSVTALGMYGVDGFTPIINPPNTAILGIGRLRTETRWDDGLPSPTTVMTLSLTWDHRAFDGAPAAEFAQSIVRYLEDPAQLNG